MKMFESNCIEFEPVLYLNNFHEQWVSGTYILTGIFPNSVSDISVENLKSEVPRYYSVVKENQKRWLPRGISAAYLIPIYQSPNFSTEVINWVKNRPKYKWAIWHEPVLFNTQTNEAVMNQNWGICGSAYRDFLAQIICPVLCQMSDADITLNGNLIARVQK